MQTQLNNQLFGSVLQLDSNEVTIKTSHLKNALNAQVDSWDGSSLFITNALGNHECGEIPCDKKLIGEAKIDNDDYVLFFCDNQSTPPQHEIGILDTNTCTYKTTVISSCLNFNCDQHIQATYKYVCDSRFIYFVDGINPDRYINLDGFQKEVIGNNNDTCKTPIYGPNLDCEAIKQVSDINIPCAEYSAIQGNLPNGVYQIAIKYPGKSNYYIYNEITLYSKLNQNGLRVNISGLDLDEWEYNLCLIGNTANGQTIVNIGNFRTTNTGTIIITDIFNKPHISYEELTSRMVHYSVSKNLISFDDRLIKAEVKESERLHYQPFANDIKSNWVVKRVLAKNAHKHKSFMRDETYVYFIQWFFKDGSESCLYHIPNNTPNINNTVIANRDVYDEFECCVGDYCSKRYWEVYNTASVTYTDNRFPSDSCNEVLVLKGEFGQYESLDKYPDTRIKVRKDANGNLIEDLLYDDIACTNIRLHKFPDNCLTHIHVSKEDCNEVDYIDILGVEFSNIKHPVDYEGKKRTDVSHYRIFYADRTGHEGILSKGMVFNLGEITKKIDGIDEKFYFQNFPYNDLRDGKNHYLSNEFNTDHDPEGSKSVVNVFSHNKFTYFTPEHQFAEYPIGVETCNYGELIGRINGGFYEVSDEPKQLLLTNTAALLSTLVGGAIGVINYFGVKSVEVTEIGDSFTHPYKTKSKYSGTTDGYKTDISLNLQSSVGPLVGGPPLNYAQTPAVGFNGETESEIPSGPKLEDKIKIVNLSISTSESGKIELCLNVSENVCKAERTIKIEFTGDAFGASVPFPVDFKFKQGETRSCTIVEQGQFNESIPAIGIYEFNDNDKTFDSRTVKLISIGTCSDLPNGIRHSHGSQTTTKRSESIADNIGSVFGFKLPEGPGGIINKFNRILPAIYFGLEGMKTAVDAIRTFLPKKQYAYQFNSKAVYNKFVCNQTPIGNRRRQLKWGTTMINSNVIINSNRINNYNRESCMYLELGADYDKPTNIDVSRFISSDLDNCGNAFNCNTVVDGSRIQAVNYYIATKTNNRNQYNTLENLQLHTTGCILSSNGTINSTGELYDGDTWISRFTFTRKFPLFLDITVSQLNDASPIDYREYDNLCPPTFWINSEPVDTFSLLGMSLDTVLDILPGTDDGIVDRRFNLDCWNPINLEAPGGVLPNEIIEFISNNMMNSMVVDGKFYKYVSGQVDFWVESSYQHEYRETDETPMGTHYPLVDYNLLQKSDRQHLDNTYIYPQYLRTYPFQHILPLNCIPNICKFDDNKVVYSDRNIPGATKDSWLNFPTLNYTQFSKDSGKFTKMHRINGSQLLFAFEDAIFLTRPSEDTIISSSGAEYNIGVGDIFSRSLQRLSDDITGYTGSVDPESFINTRHGTTWVDRKRKKIYLFSGGLKEISQFGINQWLQSFMDDYNTDYSPQNYFDSIKVMYDNRFDVFYFTHLKKENYRYSDTCETIYSKDSWTLSYKEGLGWVSFFSFKPMKYLSLANDFLSYNFGRLWKHNDRRSYHRYYNVDYDYMITPIINANYVASVLQSIEVDHETIYIDKYGNKTYLNDVFFDRGSLSNEFCNSGLQQLSFRKKANVSADVRLINNNDIEVIHVENNSFRMNRFSNLATSQPHLVLGADGHTYEYKNIDERLNPRLRGKIRGNYFRLVLMNTKHNDKKFTTKLTISLTDSISK